MASNLIIFNTHPDDRLVNIEPLSTPKKDLFHQLSSDCLGLVGPFLTVGDLQALSSTSTEMRTRVDFMWRRKFEENNPHALERPDSRSWRDHYFHDRTPEGAWEIGYARGYALDLPPCPNVLKKFLKIYTDNPTALLTSYIFAASFQNQDPSPFFVPNVLGLGILIGTCREIIDQLMAMPPAATTRDRVLLTTKTLLEKAFVNLSLSLIGHGLHFNEAHLSSLITELERFYINVANKTMNGDLNPDPPPYEVLLPIAFCVGLINEFVPIHGRRIAIGFNLFMLTFGTLIGTANFIGGLGRRRNTYQEVVWYTIKPFVLLSLETIGITSIGFAIPRLNALGRRVQSLALPYAEQAASTRPVRAIIGLLYGITRAAKAALSNLANPFPCRRRRYHFD